MIETYTHIAWRSMKQRCYSIKCKDYPSYGGRGIVVCDRWKNSYQLFLFDLGERPNNTTLERVNVDGNYEPKNCIWASAKDQAGNRRNNRIVFYKGQDAKLIALCRTHKLNLRTVRSRIRSGWNEKDWFKQPWELGTRYKAQK